MNLSFRTLAVVAVVFSSVASVSSATGATTTERLLLRGINAQRADAGLTALRLSPALGRAARRHSRDMARRCTLDHGSANGTGAIARIRIFVPRARAVGEIIAMAPRARSAVRLWVESPPHREAMLDERIPARRRRGRERPL